MQGPYSDTYREEISLYCTTAKKEISLYCTTVKKEISLYCTTVKKDQCRGLTVILTELLFCASYISKEMFKI
jgi:hypothetical protein